VGLGKIPTDLGLWENLGGFGGSGFHHGKSEGVVDGFPCI
jgi:hypothetical protein